MCASELSTVEWQARAAVKQGRPLRGRESWNLLRVRGVGKDHWPVREELPRAAIRFACGFVLAPQPYPGRFFCRKAKESPERYYSAGT
jgi:hypothetical protein